MLNVNYLSNLKICSLSIPLKLVWIIIYSRKEHGPGTASLWAINEHHTACTAQRGQSMELGQSLSYSWEYGTNKPLSKFSNFDQIALAPHLQIMLSKFPDPSPPQFPPLS